MIQQIPLHPVLNMLQNQIKNTINKTTPQWEMLINEEDPIVRASVASLKNLLKCNDEDLFQACSSYQLIAIKQKYDKIQLIRVKSELCKYIIEGSLQDQMPTMLKLAKDIIAYFELYELFLEAPDLLPTLNSEQIKKGNNIPKQEENIEQLQLKLFECKIDVQDLRLKRKELVNKAEQKISDLQKFIDKINVKEKLNKDRQKSNLQKRSQSPKIALSKPKDIRQAIVELRLSQLIRLKLYHIYYINESKLNIRKDSRLSQKTQRWRFDGTIQWYQCGLCSIITTHSLSGKIVQQCNTFEFLNCTIRAY
ncbi:hypothetical protein pb186bvf_001187 [Paramecium bursaria]